MAVRVRGTVIVVDGCVEDHASLERILDAHGFAVSRAKDGDEVLELLQGDTKVSLVLLKLGAPKWLDNVRDLRRRNGSLPVALFSGSPVAESVKLAVEESGAKLVEQSLGPEELLCVFANEQPSNRGWEEDSEFGPLGNSGTRVFHVEDGEPHRASG
jgi:DNA-binding response OmpR family regulator